MCPLTFPEGECEANTVNSTELGRDTNVGLSRRNYLDWVHCDGKTHPKRGQHLSRVLDVIQREKAAEHQHVPLCLLIATAVTNHHMATAETSMLN